MTTISRVKGDESGKPYSTRLPISSANVIIPSQDNKHAAITQGMTNIDTRGTISEVIAGDEKSDKDSITSDVMYAKYDILGQIVKHNGCGEEDQRSEMEEHRGGIVVSDNKEVIDNDDDDDEEYAVNDILLKSRHRDGSIYRGMDTWWKKDYLIADCNEKLAKTLVDGGLVELYGYIAVRDELDPLLNYVVNFSRDDPIIVEQGSLINMAGPKRGIDMMDFTLIEYDMRIKTGEQEKDDLQLIDGASMIGPAGLWNLLFTIHIPGNHGAVDITLSCLDWAAEATVEVLILEVQSSFNLLLGCLTSGLDKEIQLFDGAIAESLFLKRSVVSVTMDSLIDLKFKVGALSSSFDQHFFSFKAKTHGHDTQEINTAFALISVKVIWSTLPEGLD